MKKIFKLMMMALAAIVLTIGFAACSSDDDDSSNIYTAGFTNVKISGSSADTSLEIMQQIESAYNSVGIKESFTASSDADVKAKAQQAEKKLSNIDWKGLSGNMTYTIKNVKSQNTVYSKTFSSTDSGSNAN